MPSATDTTTLTMATENMKMAKAPSLMPSSLMPIKD
jgi:hypothetical protein